MDRFDEIEVKRIRIVDASGTLRMSISGKPQMDALFRGEPIIEQNRPTAGLLFFTEEGTECGGIAYRGKSSSKDGAEAGSTFTMDAYEQDQVVWLNYSQRGEKRNFGLGMSERPLTPMPDTVAKVRGWRKWPYILRLLLQPSARASMTPRLFLGKRQNGDAGLWLISSRSRQRLRILVDRDNKPRIELLEKRHKVKKRLPPLRIEND